MIDKLIKTIDAEKEVLSSMPLKTKKNKKNYLDTINTLLKKYQNEEKEIKQEITKRYQKVKDISENPKINELNLQISSINSDLYLINEYLTSFEKLGLDRVIYGLNHFYKENLIRVNKLVLKAINIFKEAGINLTPAYFDYSHYTYDYMLVFFKEMDKDLKSDLIKDTFESIYWKCPDIITHLDLNIRYLYYLNKEQIDKYFSNKKKELLLKYGKNEEQIMNEYYSLLVRKDEYLSICGHNILKDFMMKKKNIADFEYSKINKDYEKLINDPEYLKNNLESINENINKLDHSLYEYQNYLTFKFIIDDLKLKFKEKDSYKNKLKDALKEITKDENNLRKLNFKIFKLKNSKSNKKDNIELLLSQANNMIVNLKTKYDNLEKISFNDRVLNTLNSNSNYLDALKLALSDYSYLTSLIESNDDSLIEDEVKLKVYKLQTFVNCPYNMIINNIFIEDEKDVSNIIADRYRLLNMDITNDKLLFQNIDDLIVVAKNITFYNNILKSNIKIEQIFFAIKAKEILGE